MKFLEHLCNLLEFLYSSVNEKSIELRNEGYTYGKLEFEILIIFVDKIFHLVWIKCETDSRMSSFFFTFYFQ